MLKPFMQMEGCKIPKSFSYPEHRPLEIEAIFGNPLRKAQAVGVDLVQISCLYHQLKFLDARGK